MAVLVETVIYLYLTVGASVAPRTLACIATLARVHACGAVLARVVVRTEIEICKNEDNI